MKIKHEFIGLIIIFLMQGCTDSNKLETSYIKDGQVIQEVIIVDDIISAGTIKNYYIDTITFSILDSIEYENNNPDRRTHFQTPVILDFGKPIVKYSPEYYSLFVSHHITKAINYYNMLFNGKLDFNSQKKYKSIEVVFGDVPIFSRPNNYIIPEKSNPSPSLIYHEIGHRAFWLIEKELGIKFKGLSIIHMGLLEYYTVSLNNSPLVVEEYFPESLLRDASFLHQYPLDDSYKLDYTFDLFKEGFQNEMKDTNSIIAKYCNNSMIFYKKILDKTIDNHRGGMVLTSTLWRIREQLGQEKTDKLVAETILNLNDYMNMRSEFYLNDDLVEKIWWYDVYYGLVHKDNELFNGEAREIIKTEFKRTGYPVEIVDLSTIETTYIK